MSVFRQSRSFVFGEICTSLCDFCCVGSDMSRVCVEHRPRSVVREVAIFCMGGGVRLWCGMALV